MKILIVDDNKEMREVLKLLLRSEETEFCECSDGVEVLEAYQRFQPHWVVMDVRMQKMDGLGATSVLKQQYPQARVAIVTDYTSNEIREEAKRVGADNFVSKEEITQLEKIVYSKK